ncbi:D123-domain-containing protein [Xylogone sp. PMI_703]|nr:D123-domain-containing protein [Xylogone sp. PMI_703]
MPGLEPTQDPPAASEPLTRLPFPPVTKEHILHCSYEYWHQRYRSRAIKSRIIPLSPEFLSYLREDGIVLPSEATPSQPDTYNDTSTSTGWDSEPQPEPQHAFPEIHQKIKDAIKELGGLVAPKLNWSAPKDATWISMKKNSMECSTPSDIYLLLKSSDFITHDLEHAFDDTADGTLTKDDIQYVLVLRKWFKVNPSCEFRCFVRDRQIIGICQRDLNHFDFLFPFIPTHISTIQSFFTESTLKDTFPEPNFVFDIYLPEPYDKVRLMDINPWAPRTDPLLFSWLELLTMSVPRPLLGIPDSKPPEKPTNTSSDEDTEDSENTDFPEEEIWTPELRLVKKDDPEAYSFASPQYSAHKLPKDVVDASLSGESGMRDFAAQWQKMINGELEMADPDGDGSSDEEESSATPR